MENLSDKLNIIETKLKTIAKKLLGLKRENEMLKEKNASMNMVQREFNTLKIQNNKLMHAKQTLGLMQEENAKLKSFQTKNQELVKEINQLKKAQLSFNNNVDQENRKLKAIQNTNQQLLAENAKLRNIQKQSPGNLPAAAENTVRQLELENNRLKQQIEKDKSRVLDLQTKLSQNSNSAHPQKTSPDNNRIKREIDLYITEIDKCIELINE